MPTPSHRSARRRGIILGAALSSRKAKGPVAAPAQPVQQAAPPAAPQANSTAAQLTELKGLVDSGIITQADFDAKKQQILGL